MAVRGKANVGGGTAAKGPKGAKGGGGGEALSGREAFLAKAKQVEALFKKARETEGNQFGNDNNQDLPEGNYQCLLTGIQIGVTKKGNPYISHRWEVEEGDYAGETFSFFRQIDLSKTKEKQQVALEQLCRDTQLWNVSTKEVTLAELVEFWEEKKVELEKGKLKVSGEVRFTLSKDGERKFPNLNKLADAS